MNVGDSLLDRAKRTLESGSPEAAYAMVSTRNSSDELQNLAAVCLMRMGKAEEALTMLRRLVLPSEGLVMEAHVPAKYKVNFATALLLSGNLGGCLATLREIGDDPSAKRLAERIAQWKSSLGTMDKIRLVMGSDPKSMPTIDPPGEP